MKYAFIRAQSQHHGIERLCRLMAVSTSGYYDWRDRPVSVHAKRDKDLKIKMRHSHFESHGIYGPPPLYYEDLKEQGEQVGRKRVARLMQEEAIKAKAVKAFKRTTLQAPTLPVAENMLNQDFLPADRTNAGSRISPISARSKAGSIWLSSWTYFQELSWAGRWTNI